MRVALLSDVHGNLPALDASLAVLREAGVDMYVSAGDVIGYGPHPAACIDRLREIGAVGVAGNHELFALGRLPADTFSPIAIQSLDWTRRILGPDRIGWLSRLPMTASVGPVVIAHAALDGAHEYVVRPRQAARQLGLLAESFPEARILVLGHTHQPVYRPEGGSPRLMAAGGSKQLSGSRVLVNPGSVGQSRQWERRPRARFALLDLDEWSGRWYAARYDDSAVVRDMTAAGLPAEAIHIRPTAPRALARVVRARLDLSLPSQNGSR